jgi:hypothetical protein
LDFNRLGEFKKKVAFRWLICLNYNFYKAGYNPPSPKLFLKAIKMLLKGDIARRLDLTPKIKKIIDKRSTAITIDVKFIKK